MKTYEINVDTMIDFDATQTQSIRFSQNDKNTARLTVSITRNNEVIDISNMSLVCYSRRPDGSVLEQLMTIIDAAEGIAEVILAAQTLSVEGVITNEIEMTRADNSVEVTSAFSILATKAIKNNALQPTPPEITLINQLLARIAAMESVINVQAQTVTIPDNTHGRVGLFGVNGGVDTKKWNSTTNKWESV